ncbi:hypothetical protein GCM10023168_19170 [Fodinibacter luteus]|uniref:Peptidase M12A domain-containing protein n=1 Tax=Fodinibacter luteus TaxID=552064 RepID=A0ABP8KEN1_9MICO
MAETPGRGPARKSSTSKRTARAKVPDNGTDAVDVNPELSGTDEVRTALITGLTFGPKAVQYSVVDGRAMFEGDIDLGSVEEVEAANAALRGEGIEAGVVLPGSQFRWPGGRVPYEVDPAMPDQQRVTDAIAHVEANTAIRFVLRTPANAASLPNYVRFVHGSGCSSAVGMRGGRQDISLGTGCDAGRGIHEIGHALGLWHEQSREDRDLFVRIHLENVQAGREHNFNQHITDGDDVGPYDYGSIMHYERTAFSRNGLETVTPINPPTATIGQRDGLSPGDIAAIASMYGAPQPPVVRQPVKKLLDDPPGGGFKKLRDDPPFKKRLDDPAPFKKIRDDGPQGRLKKVTDDVPRRFPFPFPRPPIGPLGDRLSPFLLATGHHADVVGAGEAAEVAEVQAAAVQALEEAAAAVEQARANVVALQTALTGATAELARAQGGYEALLATLQDLGGQ